MAGELVLVGCSMPEVLQSATGRFDLRTPRWLFQKIWPDCRPRLRAQRKQPPHQGLDRTMATGNVSRHSFNSLACAHACTGQQAFSAPPRARSGRQPQERQHSGAVRRARDRLPRRDRSTGQPQERQHSAAHKGAGRGTDCPRRGVPHSSCPELTGTCSYPSWRLRPATAVMLD